jgi:hypothetical protein
MRWTYAISYTKCSRQTNYWCHGRLLRLRETELPLSNARPRRNTSTNYSRTKLILQLYGKLSKLLVPLPLCVKIGPASI